MNNIRGTKKILGLKPLNFFFFFFAKIFFPKMTFLTNRPKADFEIQNFRNFSSFFIIFHRFFFDFFDFFRIKLSNFEPKTKAKFYFFNFY